MECMSEQANLISSYHCCLYTQAARWKAGAPEQLTCAHLYLDIAKSGYLFHGYSGGWTQEIQTQHDLVHVIGYKWPVAIKYRVYSGKNMYLH